MRRFWRMIIGFCAVFLLVGCGKSFSEEKVADLTYAIVEVKDCPQELVDMIEEKKASAFKLTYTEGAEMYLVVGYGEQESSGYSIRLNDCYLTQNHVYVNADLIGPDREEPIDPKPTYPVLVIKTESRSETIVFDV